MTDFVTALPSATAAALRSWFDSTVPATIGAGDWYIADCPAGNYDLGSVGANWTGKTVGAGGGIMIRAATAARLNTITRALRGGTDGVCFTWPNTNISFQQHFVFDGLQLYSAAPSAAIALEAYSTLKQCILDGVFPYFGNIYITLEDCVVMNNRDGDNPAIYLGNTTTLIGCTIINFGTGESLRVNSANSIIKNNIVVSIGGNAVGVYSGGFDASSTNNAFSGSTTYGANSSLINAADHFVSVANIASCDLRLKAGSSLATAGATGIGSGLDIYYQTRTAPVSIGAFEKDSGGGGSALNAAASGSDTASGTAAGTVTGGAAGTITIPPFIDFGTGQLKKGMAYQVDVRNISTGAHLLRKTGLTTHATTGGGSFSDAALATGTTYEVVTRLADGSIGVWDYTAT